MNSLYYELWTVTSSPLGALKATSIYQLFEKSQKWECREDVLLSEKSLRQSCSSRATGKKTRLSFWQGERNRCWWGKSQKPQSSWQVKSRSRAAHLSSELPGIKHYFPILQFPQEKVQERAKKKRAFLLCFLTSQTPTEDCLQSNYFPIHASPRNQNEWVFQYTNWLAQYPL